jgi:hypothetical protein
VERGEIYRNQEYNGGVLVSDDVWKFARRYARRKEPKPEWTPELLRRYQEHLKIHRAFWNIVDAMYGLEFTPEETEAGRRFQRECEERDEPMFHGPRLYVAWIRLTRQHPEWFGPAPN